MNSIDAHDSGDLIQIISENLNECMEDIFDERNNYLMEEACEFLSCLETLSHCKNQAMKELIEEVVASSKALFGELAESDIPINQILNIKSNVDDVHITDNQLLPDVYVFSTLYDKGYIKNSYMQMHVATQLQTMKSTISDLMGKDRVGRALRPKNPRLLVSDWIDYQSVTGWNSALAKGSMEALPSIESLLTAMLPQPDCLEQSIEEGTYEDMSVNTLMSYTFASVAALVVKQEFELTKGYYDILEDLISFQRIFGLNGFFISSVMAVNLAFAIRLHRVYLENSDRDNGEAPENRLARTLQEKILRENAETFERWTKDERNLSILLPSKNDYPRELATFMQEIQSVFGFSVAKEAVHWELPIPITMQSLRDDTLQEGLCDNMLEESVKIGLGIAEIEATIESMMESYDEGKDASTRLDSLTERFQVESEQTEATNPFGTLSVIQIHATIMEHQNRLFNNALRYDRGALKTSLAENLLMLEWLDPMLCGSNLSIGEVKVLKEDAIQMDFQNKKYIDVVEMDSMESLHAYVKDNREDLTNGIVAIVNGT